MSRLTEAQLIRRVHDRFGFGAAPGELATAQRNGLDAVLKARWAQLADPQVTDPPALDESLEKQPGRSDAGSGAGSGPTGSDRPRGKPDQQQKKDRNAQRRQNQQKIIAWWLDQMVASPTQLPERLTWFWHGHFATSLQKVKVAGLMLEQNTTLRSVGTTTFRPLAQKMIIDPAMLIWLDGPKNTVRAPNENLGREFMELFTLGHGDYSEDDVKAAARALTGWKVQRANGKVRLAAKQHDSRPKTILGKTADYDAHAFVDLVCDQADGHAFVISRLWARLVSPTAPDAAAQKRLAVAWGADGDIRAVLAAIAAEPAFADSASSLVKQPTEWLVGVLRAFGVRPSKLDEAQQKKLINLLRGTGQLPFLPPSVGGWPSGHAWLTTAAALSRTQAAQLITGVADLGPLREVAVADRPEYLRTLLGTDRLSSRSREAIADVADRPAVAAAVAACTPEYVVSA